MSAQLYTITNTTGNPVQLTDSNNNPVTVVTSVSPISLASDQYATAVSIFGSSNVVLYVAPSTPAVTNNSVYQEGVTGTAGTPSVLFGGITPPFGYEITNMGQPWPLLMRENGVPSLGGDGVSVPIIDVYRTPPSYQPQGPVQVVSSINNHNFIARSF